MFDPIVVSIASFVVSATSLVLSWRVYHRDTAAQRHSLAATKAIAAQRLIPVLDFGLRLSVASNETIGDYHSDAPVFAGMASSVAAAVDDVALAFPIWCIILRSFAVTRK
jgi:hypothetical protein